MKFHLQDDLIPGTIRSRSENNGLSGLDFLKQIFFVSDGVMLSQIRDLSGIDGSTLQNWTKRGWVSISKQKKYDMNQVAHIFIINMLRSCMQLDKISFLIEYINGDLEDTSDDIISDSRLYDYICKILDCMTQSEDNSLATVAETVQKVTKDYTEPFAGAKARLQKALEIIVTTYYASILRRHAETLLDNLT